MSHTLQAFNKPTITILVAGLAFILVGVGLIGTLISVRGNLEGFDATTMGLIMSGYYLGYIIGTFLCPRIIRRVGHIRAFTAFASLTCAATLSFGLLPDPVAWGVLRVLGGIGTIGLYMVVESWINEQVSTRTRGTVFSLYTATTLGALAGGQFLLLTGDPATQGLFAVAAIAITLGAIPIAVTRVHEPAPIQVPQARLSTLYALSPLAFQGTLLAGLATSMFWGMGAVYAKQIGLDSLGIASFLAATIAGGAMLQWPIGHLSDRLDRRAVLVAVSWACALVALVSAWTLESGMLPMLLTAFVYGALLFPVYALSVAHGNDHVPPEQVLAATRGLLLVYGTGAILGPALAGVAMDQAGPRGMPLLASLFMATLGLFGIYRMTRRAPPARDEQGEFVVMVRTSQAAAEMLPQADPEVELDLEEPPR